MPTPTPTAPPPAPASRERKNLGVRLSDEDRAFLAQVAPGAPSSDAVRAVIRELREVRQTPATVQAALDQLRPWMAPIVAAFNGEGQEARSVVGEEIARELWNLLAQLRQAALTLPTDAHRLQARQVMERLAIEGSFTLTDALLRQSLPQAAAALEPTSVRQRFRQSKDLLVTTLATVGRDEPPRSRNGA